MGLIARELEANGIATTSVSLAKDLTEAVGVPRSVFIKWPLGHPFGEPHKPAQQRTIIFDALALLITETEPGNLINLGYRWKREKYSEPNWDFLKKEKWEFVG